METKSVDLARLRWRCRRGMRELDEAMLTYLDQHYTSASSEEQQLFVELQEMQDPELFQLISGKAREARYQTLVDKITRSLGSRT